MIDALTAGFLIFLLMLIVGFIGNSIYFMATGRENTKGLERAIVSEKTMKSERLGDSLKTNRGGHDDYYIRINNQR
jgi:hypothetical protein